MGLFFQGCFYPMTMDEWTYLWGWRSVFMAMSNVYSALQCTIADINSKYIQMSDSEPVQASVHPLVLLSIVDHFNRLNLKQRNKRAIGALLGTVVDGVVQVVNSYAIPFQQDLVQPNIWFLDHLYHQAMFAMMRKISHKEKLVGWYTTGSSFKSHDILINDIFRNDSDYPVFLVVDVEHNNELGLPTQAFISRDEVNAKTGSISRSFFHIESRVVAHQPEEIGVEHLLREIKEISLNSLEASILLKVQALKGLQEKIGEILKYLKDVRAGKLPPNNKIMFILQEIINFLPNLNSQELTKAFAAKNNDMMFAVYICAMTRCVLALHTLIFVGKENQEKEKQKEREKEKERELEADLKEQAQSKK